MLIFFSIVNLNIAVIFDLAVQKGFQLQTTEVHVYLLDVMDFSKKKIVSRVAHVFTRDLP